MVQWMLPIVDSSMYAYMHGWLRIPICATFYDTMYIVVCSRMYSSMNGSIEMWNSCINIFWLVHLVSNSPSNGFQCNTQTHIIMSPLHTLSIPNTKFTTTTQFIYLYLSPTCIMHALTQTRLLDPHQIKFDHHYYCYLLSFKTWKTKFWISTFRSI